MSDMTRFVITTCERLHRMSEVEMCEHKGVGHPDSLCDGVAQAVSLALNRAYLQAYGRIQHYNVDKALYRRVGAHRSGDSSCGRIFRDQAGDHGASTRDLGEPL